MLLSLPARLRRALGRAPRRIRGDRCRPGDTEKVMCRFCLSAVSFVASRCPASVLQSRASPSSGISSGMHACMQETGCQGESFVTAFAAAAQRRGRRVKAASAQRPGFESCGKAPPTPPPASNGHAPRQPRPHLPTPYADPHPHTLAAPPSASSPRPPLAHEATTT